MAQWDQDRGYQGLETLTPAQQMMYAETDIRRGPSAVMIGTRPIKNAPQSSVVGQKFRSMQSIEPHQLVDIFPQ